MERAKMEGAASAAGKSLLEMLWDELDRIVDRLMAGLQYEDLEQAENRGQAQGVAYCIAVIESPYKPNVPAVKDRAMERWEEANAE